MNLLQLMQFQPQTSPVEHGAEPSLTFMVAHYYLSNGFSEEETNELVTQYFGAFDAEVRK